MTTRPMICLLALVISACAPTPPSPLGQAEVQEFVRQYMAATNAWDASKIMELIHRGKPPALPEDSQRFDLCGGRVSP